MKTAKKKRIIKTAWLVTWEWCGKHANPHEEKVVILLNYKWGGKMVCKIVEQFYVYKYYTLSEKINCAKHPNKNPYSAKFVIVNGIPFEGRITCGSNPFLYARMVSNVVIKKDKKGNEGLSWTEIPDPAEIKNDENFTYYR